MFQPFISFESMASALEVVCNGWQSHVRNMQQENPFSTVPLVEILPLESYDISPDLGFLRSDPPLTVLSDPYYARWNQIAHDLPALRLSGRLRAAVDELPILSCARLSTSSEWRRAYSTLAFICHAYIWGGEFPVQVMYTLSFCCILCLTWTKVVPPSLAVPFICVCQKLDLPPVATYAAVVLWNITDVLKAECYDDLGNFATILSFTGSLDESWFYLISVAIEKRGGPLITLMLRGIQAARENDTYALVRILQDFAKGLVEVSSILGRIYEKCDPHTFYHCIRPFLAGSKNMEDAGLTNEIIFDDGTGTVKPIQVAGGSNAQSSLLQFFDIVLGVDHQHSGAPNFRQRTRSTSSDSRSSIDQTYQLDRHTTTSDPSKFINDMRNYMPAPHRRFLSDVAKVSNIRGFVRSHPNNETLRKSYNACLAALVNIRNTHLEIVSRYIIIQGRQSQKVPQNPHNGMSHIQESVERLETHQKSGYTAEDLSFHGTGGTMLIPLLKQVRDKTRDALLRRITSTLGNRDSGRRRDRRSKHRERLEGLDQ
jgi:indoleamine 2,3-dioxygenase